MAQGYKTFFLQNNDGNMLETQSVAAGLDYVGVSPILAYLGTTGRVRFEAATNDEVTETLRLVMRTEGIIPALESTHGFAAAVREAGKLSKDTSVLVNMSGRGDKDIFTVADALVDENWKSFIRNKAEEYNA